MRRLYFALVVLLVSATAATGVRLHAMTECERWIAEYRDALAHSPTVQRANAARHRLHHYVHRKLAVNTQPKPRVLPVRYRRPKMSREEALHKMEFACGDIGLQDPTVNELASSPAPMFMPAAEEGTGDEMPVPSGLVAQNTPPSGGSGGYPMGGVPGAPLFPGGGGGNGIGGGSNTGGAPGTDTPGPPPPPPPGVPTAEAPEPGSFILLATGMTGVFGLVRRRLVRG